jgi:hypothetical protein
MACVLAEFRTEHTSAKGSPLCQPAQRVEKCRFFYLYRWKRSKRKALKQVKENCKRRLRVYNPQIKGEKQRN